jgi:hypothetical protein
MTTTSVSPTVRSIWVGWRGVAAAGALILLTAIVLAAVAGGGSTASLDPRGVDRNGSRALAQLLGRHGVSVVRTEGVAAARGSAGQGDTLLVVGPEFLSPQLASELRSTGADLVVIGASDDAVVRALLPGAEVSGSTTVQARLPDCGLLAAQLAGKATSGGYTYSVGEVAGDVVSCYPDKAAGSSLVQVREPDGRSITLLGTGTPLRNDRLADQGNAALTMNLLGGHDHLIWDMPRLEDFPAAERQSPFDLLPSWLLVAVAQLFLAVFLIALWRARRLGPVVAEPLPVVVRASEATEGRARLYARAHARGRAADQLRRAAVERMAPRLGISGPVDGLDPTLVGSVVAHRSGRSESEVTDLLYGEEPVDDDRLVALARALDQLEKEVRRT